ncbi:MAG: tRNA threonylcarbamoyladenosine dehydratase [Desulfuromonadales bacterium]
MEEHRFSRMELLAGTAGLETLRKASVAVFGIGGVGSFAVEALVRAGVGRLTLVDFDEICLTNTNRQIHATSETVGKSKVQVMAERCRAINPRVEIEPLSAFYEAKNSEELLTRGGDYVLDCIDHITSKLHLIQACKEKQIPIISSMGAANKLDPSRVEICDLSLTYKCRLARIIRKELRRRGIERGVKVVFSTEDFRPLSTQGNLCSQNCICPNKEEPRWRCTDRRVILGSSSTIPPMFGMMMAGEVIRELLGEGDN